ncbi:hypothetical protein BDB01DRAFT_845958 [Pilobolus umbonatus]|nr:hypothetical protein BDB01DRAFT_845958 [Pilobolus umbonatus]
MVNAQQNSIVITNPLQGTVFNAGSEAQIRWLPPPVTVITKIVLARGENVALQPVDVIAYNVDATALTYVWNIKPEVADGDDYALMFGDAPNLSYAGPFSIRNNASIPTQSTGKGPTASTKANVTPGGQSNGVLQSTYICTLNIILGVFTLFYCTL